MKWGCLLWLVGLILYSVTFDNLGTFQNHALTIVGAGLWLISLIIFNKHFREKS